MRINTCINKSLFQALKSLPVVLLVIYCQQWSGNWTGWSQTLFLKTHYRHLGVIYWSLMLFWHFQNSLHTISASVTLLAVLPAIVYIFFCGNCWLSNRYMDSQNWMEYSASNVAPTALLLSQNGLRPISEHLISKNFLGEHAPRSPSLVCLCMHTYTSDTHVTPLLAILATSLYLLIFLAVFKYYFE